ncbi:SAM-dependent DNA methyltransferase, partial [Streptococcus suis]|nr:SAM-dependent DNA methyltransferase [Streptococcus suis]
MEEHYIVQVQSQVQGLFDDLKAVFTHAGLGGEAGEYKLLTQSFLYKFLNDKFLYEALIVDNRYDYQGLLDLSEEDYDWFLDDIGTKTAHLKPEQLIESLHRQQNQADFAEIFEQILNQIAIDNNAIFSVHTDGGTDIRLFDQRLITDTISDASKRNEVAASIINLLARVKFDQQIFSQGFDFFSTLFEYMIKDYNKDGGGKYAEYYTPHSVAKIIAAILVGNDQPSNVKIYDPSAGSGTLLMNLASQIGTDRTSVYSQDISQKSSNLLRLNLILNGLQHSIHNIVQGNTILNNRHAEKMDYIVSNPPFKLD